MDPSSADIIFVENNFSEPIFISFNICLGILLECKVYGLLAAFEEVAYFAETFPKKPF